MTDPAAAIQSMIDNLPAQTGRSLEQWFQVLDATGLNAAGTAKHGELMAALKKEHGVSHGFANGIVLQYRAQGETTDDLVTPQYSGPKEALRPIYDALISEVSRFGDDVEIAPKKTSVSLRRSKQFALIEAPSAKRVQLGIQLKGDPPTERLLLAGGMCSHKVTLTTVDDIDAELLGWLREAYARA